MRKDQEELSDESVASVYTAEYSRGINPTQMPYLSGGKENIYLDSREKREENYRKNLLNKNISNFLHFFKNSCR